MHPEHGIDGWELVDYEWIPERGVGALQYERRTETGIEIGYRERDEPSGPWHPGWITRDALD